MSATLARQMMFLVLDLAEKGHRSKLRDMGFNDDQLARLADLKSREFTNLTSRDVNVFDIRVNPEILDICLKDLEAQKIVDDCVIAGAPNDFLYQFFGLRSKECSNLRDTLGVEARLQQRAPSNGIEEDLIIKHYQALLGDREDDDLSPEDYLMLHQTIKQTHKAIPLKAIWTAIKRYQRDAYTPTEIPLQAKGGGR